MSSDVIPCWIYKGDRLDGAYLYVAAEGDFTAVPAELMARLGALRLVMHLELTPGCRLAREDPQRVMDHLRSHGYHLQLPPHLRPYRFARGPGDGAP